MAAANVDRMAVPTRAPAPTSNPRTRPRHPGSAARRRVGAAALALGALVGAAACSSSDDVVATGPSTSGNPESPAADNPTTTTTVATSGPGTTIAVPTAPTTAPGPAASTSTSVTSVPPASSVPDPPAPSADLVAQLFWVRAPSDPRVIDIPGYVDPATGPKPLVVYGSVTNNGTTTVSQPYVTASWVDGSGTVVATFSADVVLPGSTTAAATLAPGASGDVIIVVTDAAMAERLADLVPELAAAGR